ncbi:MAG: YkgJ family cysteine cluster protein [Spirochaetales bacterium]
MPQSLQEYRNFLKEVDSHCSHLGNLHKSYLSCRRGCCECCTEISVLAIEAYSILRGVEGELLPEAGKEAGTEENYDIPSGNCVFLDTEGACRIYPFRPLICRTHGLPLLYSIEEYSDQGKLSPSKEPQWQLFYCDLNFQGITEDQWEQVFSVEAVLSMEELNEKLIRLNEKFRGSSDGISFLKAVRQGRDGALAQKELFHTGRIPLSSLGWVLL